MNKQVIKYLQAKLHIIHFRQFDTYKLVLSEDGKFLTPKELNTLKEVLKIKEDDEEWNQSLNLRKI